MDYQTDQILLIEDDPAFAQTLKEGLEREGYAVTWKTSGAKGLAHARDHRPRLIVLDIRLPDQSGFDVCRQMRQMGLRQPVIMLSAREEDMSHLFQRFHRGRNTEGYPGSGLGLAIVKAIADRHGGSVAAERYNHRTRISLQLPLISRASL